MVLLIYIDQFGVVESIHLFYEKIIKEGLGYYHLGNLKYETCLVETFNINDLHHRNQC